MCLLKNPKQTLDAPGGWLKNSSRSLMLICNIPLASDAQRQFGCTVKGLGLGRQLLQVGETEVTRCISKLLQIQEARHLSKTHRELAVFVFSFAKLYYI